MTTSTIELSMDQMNAVNGGFSPLACVLGTIFGAGKARSSAVPWKVTPSRSWTKKAERKTDTPS